MAIWSPEVLVDNTVPVTGPLTDTELRATPVPVSGPLTDTQLRATPVPISGSVSTTPTTSSSSTVTQITSTGANQTLLSANPNRKKAILFFESGTWSVKFGVGASTSSKTYTVNTGNTALEVLVWTGQIDVACTASGKLVDVTELV